MVTIIHHTTAVWPSSVRGHFGVSVRAEVLGSWKTHTNNSLPFLYVYMYVCMHVYMYVELAMYYRPP